MIFKMKFYPVSLNLKGKKCLVVGGGKVGERKTLSLLKTEAKVSLVSLSLTPRLKELCRKKKIRYVKSVYKTGLLSDCFLVIAATSDLSVNSSVYKDAGKKGILVNSVDFISESNFIVPAVFEQGDLTIAISTNGKAPCLAKSIKNSLKKTINKEYKHRLRLLEKIRERMKSGYTSRQRKQILNKLAKMSLPELKKQYLCKKYY